MTTPQNVSSRYVRNLICAGSNQNFELDKLEQRIAQTPSGLPCGFYFYAGVKRCLTFETYYAEGVTPESAVKRCLENIGVTFK